MAVSDFEKLLLGMAEDKGLDPEEFKEMVRAIRVEAAAKVRWFPGSKDIPVDIGLSHKKASSASIKMLGAD